MHNKPKDSSSPLTSGKDIYRLAENIHNLNNQYDQEVQKIINAYCKVEDIKHSHPKHSNKNRNPIQRGVTNNNLSQQKQPIKYCQNSSVTSDYSKKVKQTLKQINANRNKEKDLIRNKQQTIDNFKNSEVDRRQVSKEELSLKESSGKKIYRVVETLARRAQSYTLRHLKMHLQQQEQQYNNLIAYWRLGRCFSAWRSESILNKIEVERVKKLARDKADKKNKIAQSFRDFIILKRYLLIWKRQNKKALKHKQLEEQRRRLAIEEIINQPVTRNQVQKNSNIQQKAQRNTTAKYNQHLQSKLRGFLDDLKDKVQDKRLKTIKEYTQESEFRRSQQPSYQHSSIQQLRESEDENNEDHGDQPEIQNHIEHHQQVDRIAQRHNEANSKKPLSNQQLQKRRIQLANRAKVRKQTLESQRRKKQIENQKIQDQRKQIQKQIELQQKKLKQEQYREFTRKKKQQEEWQKRQKTLLEKAEQFSRLRTMKHYGFETWKTLKLVNKTIVEEIVSHVNKAALRMNWGFVYQRINLRAQFVLQKQCKRMDIFYQRTLERKIVQRLSINRHQQLQYKEQLFIRHDVHLQRACFKEWFRLQPTLRLQNIQYYKLRNKKAQQLRILTLYAKTFKGLRQNKEEYQRMRNIQQHKIKMQEKLKGWVSEVDLDIQQYL